LTNLRTATLSLALACSMARANFSWLTSAYVMLTDCGLRALDAVPVPESEWVLTALVAHSAFALLLTLAPSNLPGRRAILHWLRRAGRRMRIRPIVGCASVLLLALAAREWMRGSDEASKLLLIAMLQGHTWTGIWLNEVGQTDAIFAFEKDLEVRELTAWQPPPRRKYALAGPMMHAAMPQTFSGAELLPKGTTRILFVMNHQMGGLEIPFFVEHLHVEHNLYPRALADHMHFMIPAWGAMLRDAGAIDGTRENCSLIMNMGQPLLVFPGGGNEILKSKNDAKYGLKWRERAGFARMAILHGYTIVPVAAVGLEDQLDVVADIPVGKVLAATMGSKGSRAEMTLPIMKPSAGNLGQRLYFRFLEPVDTTAVGGPEMAEDKEAVLSVRNIVKDRLEAGLAQLLEEREEDPDRFILRSKA